MGLDELHYYDLYAPLVGSVKLEYTPEEAQKHVLAAVAPLGAEYQATIQRAFNERWIDLLPERRQAVGRLLERRRLRRPPVHADQLQRQVQRREHAGPRARPHDAELLLEQDAAVPAGELSDLRRRSGVHVQRVAAHRLHAQEASRTTTRGCRCSATTSRTSRARCSGRRSSRSSSCGCTRWRRRGSRSPATRSRSCTWTSRSATTATIRASASWTTTSRTSGATSRTSTATSTSSSTRRRSPRRRRSREGQGRRRRRRRSAT